MAGTVVETLITEIDADSVRLEASLASANKKIDALEAKLTGLQEAAQAPAQGFTIASGAIVAGSAAAGIAVAALGVKAVQMAAQTDGALRQIGADAPALRNDLSGVKDSIEDVAQTTGRSRDEIYAAAQEITRLGVASKAEFDAKLNAATLIADATGTQLTTAVQGVDQLTDAFNLSSDDIVKSMAKIFSASKGRVDFDSIFAGVQTATLRLQKFGIDFDTTIKGVVGALDQGLSGKSINKLLGEGSADDFRKFAANAKISTDALKELQDAAAFKRGGSDRDFQRTINDWNAALTDLGTSILPTASKALSNFATVLDAVDGKLDETRRKTGEFSATAITLGLNAKVIDPKSSDAVRLNSAFDQLRVGVLKGDLNIGSLPIEQLKELKDAYTGFVSVIQARNNGQTTVPAMLSKEYKPLLDAIDAAIAKQKTLNTTSTAGSGTVPLGPSKADVTARAEAIKAFDDAIAGASPGKGDDLNQKMLSLINGALKAKVPLDQIVTRVEALNAAIKGTQDLKAQDLNGKLDSLVAGFSASQADAYLAASRAQVTELRNQLNLLTEIDPWKRAQLKTEIDTYEADARSTAATMKLLEALQQADTAGARILADYTNKAAQLETQEQQQRDIVDNIATSTDDRTKAEQKLHDIQAQRLALSQDEISADLDAANRYGAEIVELQSRLLDATTTDKDRVTLIKQIADYQAKIVDLQKRINDLRGIGAKQAKDNTDAAAKTAQHYRDMANMINEGVGGAIELAQAFGLVNSESGQALQNIGRIASSIASFHGATTDAEKFAAVLGVVGGAVGILGSVAGGVFGESPEEKAMRETLAKNTEALQDLTREAKTKGLLGISATQSDISFLQSVITGALARTTAGIPDRFLDSSLSTAKVQGLSDDDVALINSVAQALGITFDGTVKSLQSLRQALGIAGPALGKFGSDFSSVMSEIDAEAKIIGDQGPLSNLQKILSKIGDLSPAVKDLFEGIDTSKALTADEIKTIRDRLAAALAAMEGDGLTNLGGLTGNDFGQLLETIADDLNQLAPAAQTASDKLTAALASLNNELAIHDIKDPATVFEKTAQDIAANVGGSLGDLLKSFDLTNTDPANIAAIDKAIQDLFDQLEDSPDSVDLAGLSVDQLIQILLQLHGAADNVAAGVQSAVDKMNAARSQLDTDFQVFNETDPNDLLKKVTDFYEGADDKIKSAIGGFDLSTADGRAQADQALQSLYAANRGDADLTKEILDILKYLRAVDANGGAAAGSGTTAGASAGGPASSQTAAMQTLEATAEQGDKFLGYLAALLAEVHDFHDDVTNGLSEWLRAIGSTVITPPQIPYGLGAFAGAGSVQLSVVNTQNFYGDITATTREIATEISNAVVDMVNEELGAEVKRLALLSGNTLQS